MPHLRNIRLFDVPGFENLQRVCTRFDINFTVFGGLVRNLARNLVLSEGDVAHAQLPDLFDLTPFTSDIDLVHSGDTDLTPEIMEAIYRDVPTADCFRWQLRSVKSNAVFWEAMKSNGIIPANLMSLSTNATSGIKDDWNGSLDIKLNNYRYVRNGFYRTSPLYRAGCDLELLSSLLYFRVVLEAGRVEPDAHKRRHFSNHEGFEQAREVVREAGTEETFIALQKSDYLRARLLYLLKNLIAAGNSRYKVKELLEGTGLYDFFDHVRNRVPALQESLGELIESTQSVTVSASHLGGDVFRTPHATETWVTDHDAEQALQSVLQRAQRLKSLDSGSELEKGVKVLLSSPQIELNKGASQSSQAGAGGIREFVHFAVPVSGWIWRNYKNEDLAALAVLNAISEGAPTSSFVLPALSVCDIYVPQEGFDETLLLIRVNCWGGLEYAWQIFRSRSADFQVCLQLFVLGSGQLV